MITRPTVFVLGAGASKPFGYPTGLELKQKIIDALADRSSPASKLLEGPSLFSYEDISKFQKALFQSSANSIDEFLENWPSYQDMGKRVITQVLFDCEDENSIFATPDWYDHLFRALKSGSSFEGFAENKLSVITFNYDRSLEYYLYTSLKNFFNKTGEEAAKIMNALPIIHVYGQIGYLPWQNKTSERTYGNKDQRYLVESSSLIKILHEEGDIEKAESLKKARDLLEAAEKVYFLGFGYHTANLDRLRIKILDNSSKQIYGTALGLTDRERNRIVSLTNNKIDLSLPNVGGLKILEFIREHIDLT